MNRDQLDSEGDEWSEWLLHRRYADDPAYEQHLRADVDRFAQRVLDGARLGPGMTIADIGAGEGLIAFSAIERIGPSLRALLTDISVPMLRHAEMLATQRGVHQQCTFLQCSAEKLDDIAPDSVDVVTTRSVLAYVTDKRAALREFHRILKPGGRLSIAEPIMRDDAFETIALKKAIDAQPLESRDPFLPLLHRWKAAAYPDTEEQAALRPITNYSERDLVRFACGSGFTEIHLEFHIDIFRSKITCWDVFVGIALHPWAPPLSTILTTQFSLKERELFEQALRPIVEAGQFITIERIAYLSARKPLA